ncbi:hypothetical protein H9L10_15275 [Phycicoccus endophyticus]|uniref:Uncharacterized protein n=1 Tax=Phycicoccus endophyticus TaxID=1690220 RepID=A0A7G9R1N9_9MICO|nr:hypothetical protein [Phycicoccus endophyticus]QNN49514.1 hypothetical protein H9L10_15275 [Phycicoccus endophyticus]GGL37171.1 hypothetical protein GCM10012283_19700 [Phycicoccus endophyticus]
MQVVGDDGRVGERGRFRGRIAGVGSTSGVRVVVGRWQESPFGGFADAMVERADGHRVLLAPTEQVADLVATTYTFDEVRLEPVAVEDAPGGWRIASPSLDLSLEVGRRTALGRLLRVLPRPVAESPGFATAADPVARVVLRGVRTRGTARAGRREYYGATDVRAVTALRGSFEGSDLGRLAPVDPPCRFGFSSTPRRPSVTSVTTTIVDH